MPRSRCGRISVVLHSTTGRGSEAPAWPPARGSHHPIRPVHDAPGPDLRPPLDRPSLASPAYRVRTPVAPPRSGQEEPVRAAHPGKPSGPTATAPNRAGGAAGSTTNGRCRPRATRPLPTGATTTRPDRETRRGRRRPYTGGRRHAPSASPRERDVRRHARREELRWERAAGHGREIPCVRAREGPERRRRPTGRRPRRRERGVRWQPGRRAGRGAEPRLRPASGGGARGRSRDSGTPPRRDSGRGGRSSR